MTTSCQYTKYCVCAHLSSHPKELRIHCTVLKLRNHKALLQLCRRQLVANFVSCQWNKTTTVPSDSPALRRIIPPGLPVVSAFCLVQQGLLPAFYRVLNQEVLRLTDE